MLSQAPMGTHYKPTHWFMKMHQQVGVPVGLSLKSLSNNPALRDKGFKEKSHVKYQIWTISNDML